MNRLVIALLRVYKLCISPWLPQSCRFSPTCSEYARLAFAKYGFFTASWKTVCRLARCHPFHPGGVDMP